MTDGVLDLGAALRFALSAKEKGEATVILTVVRSSRADLMPAGMRVVVSESGQVLGQASHAHAPALIEVARRALAERRSRTRSFKLIDDALVDVGVDGGDFDIYFELVVPAPHLVVVGAGHIAVPLATLGKLLDFEVSVVDDRPEYGNRERFPEADHILLGPYRDTLAAIPMTIDTCVVLVTRGHVHDSACLEFAVGSAAGYIGMIGSKRRVRTVLKHMEQWGWPPQALERVYAPVGLDIGSRTPAEIALAVMAEIIKVRNGGTGASLTLEGRTRV